MANGEVKSGLVGLDRIARFRSPPDCWQFISARREKESMGVRIEVERQRCPNHDVIYRRPRALTDLEASPRWYADRTETSTISSLSRNQQRQATYRKSVKEQTAR